MGTDDAIGSETMGALARLDATLILCDLTREAGSFGGRTGGSGVPGGVSSSSSSCCSPSSYARFLPSSNHSLLPSSITCSTCFISSIPSTSGRSLSVISLTFDFLEDGLCFANLGLSIFSLDFIHPPVNDLTLLLFEPWHRSTLDSVERLRARLGSTPDLVLILIVSLVQDPSGLFGLVFLVDKGLHEIPFRYSRVNTFSIACKALARTTPSAPHLGVEEPLRTGSRSYLL